MHICALMGALCIIHICEIVLPLLITEFIVYDPICHQLTLPAIFSEAKRGTLHQFAAHL